MRWEHVEDLRADPGIAPGERNPAAERRRSVWPALLVVAAATAFGGVIWFAYQNAKDTSGSGGPPLIKAEEGPVKVKPDQPGGQEIPFQDSTVYDRLGGKSAEQPQMEKLLPPPETPVQRVPPPTQPAPSAEATAPQASQPPASPPDILAPPKPVQPQPAPIASAAPVPSAPAPSVSPPANASGTSRLPAPQADPIGALAAAALASPPPAQAKPAAMPAEKPATGGDYRIQIGAVKTADAVPQEWARLKHRFPETLSQLKVSSDKVEVGSKGTFFRIKAGPLDESAAKSACDHLKAQGVGCIVVKS